MKLKRRHFYLILVLIVAAGLIIFREPLMNSMARALVHEDPKKKVQAIVVLGGSRSGNRIRAGVQLWKEGYGQWLVFSGHETYPGTFSQDMMKAYAISLGVPAEKILTSQMEEVSTWGEALSNLEILKRHSITSFCVVTSAFHSLRAHRVYSGLRTPDIRDFWVYPAKDPIVPIERWWETREGRKIIVLEYIKSLGFYLEHLSFG